MQRKNQFAQVLTTVGFAEGSSSYSVHVNDVGFYWEASQARRMVMD
jgi:hypothetical protein